MRMTSTTRWLLPALIMVACSSPPAPGAAPTSAVAGPTTTIVSAATTASLAPVDWSAGCPSEEGDSGVLWPDGVDLRFAPYSGGPDHGDWLRTTAHDWAAAQGLELGVASSDFYSSPIPFGLTDRVAGEQPADVLASIVGGVLTSCAETGVLAPLDELWGERGWGEALPDPVVDLATVGGHPMWAPTTFQWNPIFYRTDLFDRLDVTPPKTWDELLTICDRFVEEGGRAFTSAGAWSPPTARWFTILNLRLNGAEFHQRLLQGAESWLDPRLDAVFEHWAEAIDRRCFVDDAPDNRFRDAVDDLASGRAAMWNIGEWLFEFLPPDVHSDIDFFRMPILDDEIPVAEIVLVQGVAGRAETGGTALELVAHLSSPSTVAASYDVLGRVAVDPRLDIPYDAVHARAHAFLDETDSIVQLLEFSAEPRYAAAVLGSMVSFSRDPGQQGRLREAMEEARDRFTGGG